MSFDFSEGENEKFKETLKRMSEYIAYLEVAEQKMVSIQAKLDEKIEQHQHRVSDQLKDIQLTINELQGVMSEAGVARWRLAAEETLKSGNEHLKQLEIATEKHLEIFTKNNEEFSKTVHKSFERLDRASAYTIKNISEVISSFRISDFQQFTQQSYEIIEDTSRSVIYHLKTIIKWFHWRNLAMAFGLSFFVSTLTSYYLSGELPWVNHKKMIAQRAAGEALMNAWPTLSDAEKELILKNSKHSFL